MRKRVEAVERDWRRKFGSVLAKLQAGIDMLNRRMIQGGGKGPLADPKNSGDEILVVEDDSEGMEEDRSAPIKKRQRPTTVKPKV